MKFLYSFYLLAGAIACGVAFLLYRLRDKRNREILENFAAKHLLEKLTASVSLRRRAVKRIFIMVALLCLFFALARPQWGFRWQEVKQRGIDVLFAIDTSKSMLAQDVKPDRLSRAKLAVLDFVSQLQGDRVGLVAFSGTAFTQCPLTLDYDAFAETLNELDTNIIPKGGTNLASAIEEAVTALESQKSNHKILVLITDGEDLEGQGLVAARKATEVGLKIFAVGVGTAQGELIPVPEETGGVQFIKDAQGQVVKSRLDESTLVKIAEVTGGFYVPLGQRGEGLAQIYFQGLGGIPKEELSSKMQKVFIERFQIPLAIGILFLILEFLLKDSASSRPLSRAKNARGLVNSRSLRARGDLTPSSSFFIVLFLCFTVTAQASPQDGQRAYERGDYAKAAAEYQKVWEKTKENPVANFNLGTALYKKDFPEKASELFQKALGTDNLELQEKAYYNLGNAEFRSGEKTEKDNPQQTIPRWQSAVQAYENALKLKSDDADAKFNLELVKKKLAELQKQDQQKNEQNPQQNQQKESQDQKSKENDQQKEEQQPKPNANEQEKQNQPQNSSQQKENQQEQQKQNASPQEQEKQSEQNAQSSPEQKRKENEERLKQIEDNRKANQMTREEAENLLNALKTDEAHPAFQQKAQQGNLKETARDW